ncbi:HNH endonuclease [Delftia sp. GW456-R20]|uniref:HNH endonuclease n=1 Tax=Delftia sp. GW456-R20 TaxID=1827145 RepID=UPI001E556F85|nr:HNH endonuclease signature motif containing protein [Delftia sp. GW456-R20]
MEKVRFRGRRRGKWLTLSAEKERAMAYWWVNHKQTFNSEIEGGYIWSPQRKANGGYNQTYENLRLVKKGDTVISYADGQVKAIGVATSGYRDEGKPEDFGKAGDAWHADGWLVPVAWELLESPVRPKHHMGMLAGDLPEKYSPIRASGDGNQGVYLASVSQALGEKILDLAGKANDAALELHDEQLVELEEDQVQQELSASPTLSSTEIEQLVKARRGQGIYRTNLMQIEKRCRLTGVSDPRLLVASHIKPWKESTNDERLDGHNGLLLSPHVDRLFDRHLISFTDEGQIIPAGAWVVKAMIAWGLDPQMNVGPFRAQQKAYLALHRARITKHPH